MLLIKNMGGVKHIPYIFHHKRLYLTAKNIQRLVFFHRLIILT